MAQGDGQRQLALLKGQGYVTFSQLHDILGIQRTQSSEKKLPPPSVMVNGFRLYSPVAVANAKLELVPSLRFRAMAFDFIVGKYDRPSIR